MKIEGIDPNALLQILRVMKQDLQKETEQTAICSDRKEMINDAKDHQSTKF